MPNNTTLLIIGPTPPPFHGVAVAIQTLLRSKIAEQFQVSHLDLADRRGIQYVNKPDLHDVLLFLRQWFELIRTLIRVRPRLTYLVLSQSTIGFLRDSFLIWPALLSGSHIVIHLHGGNFREWFQGRSWLIKTYVRTVLHQATQVIVLGKSLKEQFKGLVKMSKVAVVSNGINWNGVHSFASPTRAEPLFRILHLSTLSHLKGVLVLIKALPLILQHRQDVELVCAGPWSHSIDKDWADQFIAEQGLENHVRFPGQVDGNEKEALFESADMFVFPGVQQEGQPLVVLEAMAAGLPVIFTNRGCLRDTVIDGESGIEVQINDPEKLAEAILRLVNHPERAKEMGRHARQRYTSLYTKEQHIENMIKVFTSACIDETH
jgi:glycosyltransferase involved in cell wall biosynthesis